MNGALEAQGKTRRLPMLVVVAVLCCAFAIGCDADEELVDDYGRRERGAASVNGTTVLGEMFSQAGFRVSSWRKLSPRLEKANVIVWAPDRLQAPSARELEWFDQWLSGDPARVVVYVGRDFDASPAYWNDILPNVPVESIGEANRRATRAMADAVERRKGIPESEKSDWFVYRDQPSQHSFAEVGGTWVGEAATMKGVDLKLQAVLEPNEESDYVPLLMARETPFVYQVFFEPWGLGQVIVVQNGSFLLNYSLVNHSHRVLAGKLISECGAPGQVVFLESGKEELQILQEDPPSERRTWFSMFSVWPLGLILLQFAVMGVLYLLAQFPIFGRPRELPVPLTADFGKHLSALGSLLARTKNVSYAQARLEQYQRFARRDSGATHLGKPST